MLALIAMDVGMMMVGLILAICLILSIAPDADRPRRPTPDPTPDRGRRFNALVVEDSPPMRRMLTFALSRVRELDVVQADDGIDALRRIVGTKFDIIITEINMPILDGLALVKWLRADDNYKDVPIVIIMTEDAAEDRQRALALGATVCITRPIQVQQVISLVREVLRLD